jgi:predicted nucleic acid-binding protein
MKIVIDASVWVSAFLPSDVHYSQADHLLETCLASRVRVIVPEIVLLEVAAGVARIRQHEGPGQIAAKKIERFPKIKFLPLQTAFLNKSILLATRHFLRAADSLYVAAARQSKAMLVTLHSEMLQRGAAAATVLTPANWLANVAPKG